MLPPLEIDCVSLFRLSEFLKRPNQVKNIILPLFLLKNDLICLDTEFMRIIFFNFVILN